MTTVNHLNEVSFTPTLWFEDVEIGYKLPPLPKCATKQQLVMYAGASGDFVPIHYDINAAKGAGHDEVIIHGALKSAWLAQMITLWAGINSQIMEFEVEYRAVDFPGEELVCQGEVTKKFLSDLYGVIELKIGLFKETGKVSTPGKVKLALPSRTFHKKELGLHD